MGVNPPTETERNAPADGPPPNDEPSLQNLPNPIRTELIEVVRSVSYEGPLPPPALLHDYERALPGAAQRSGS